MIFPPTIQKGDKIAIIAPATTVKKEYVDGAVERLSSMGYTPIVMPHTLGPADGSYASTEHNRLSDFLESYQDDEIKAILCARGGYGVVQLIDKIEQAMLRKTPKWIIGYSDISAFHAMMNKAGIASLHAPMAKHLTEEPSEDYSIKSMIEILTNQSPITYTMPTNFRSQNGISEGVLRGGNFAVLAGLIGSPYDLLSVREDENVVLFVEDIAEAIYSTERMLWHLKHIGTLNRIKGLIIGQFTEYKPDKNWETTEEMLSYRLNQFGINNIPIAFDFPVGHVSRNYPMIEGATVQFEVSKTETKLIMNRR